MHPLKSLLFIPGNRQDMLNKATGLNPDAYVPDMEDSIPISQKTKARETTAPYLKKLAQAGPLVIPRINPLNSGLMESDLEKLVTPDIYGISIGKINSPEEVRCISKTIDQHEQRIGVSKGNIKLVIWIETAKAIVNAFEICSSSNRIVGAAFGAEDFANDMCIERTDHQAEIEYPRSVVCVAAKAAEISALDTPYFKFRDPEGLKKDTIRAKTLGFSGKFAIHPSQIDTINETFVPSAQEIENARKVLRAIKEAEARGSGATSIDGKVIDAPVVKRAEYIMKQSSQNNIIGE